MEKAATPKTGILAHPHVETAKIFIESALILAILGIGGYTILNKAVAASSCDFATTDTTMTLQSDCETDSTIFVPEGMTLDGRGHTIAAVDPTGGHFTGAVIKNLGSVAHVENVRVTAHDLANVCDSGGDRLRGIMFEGASGSIMHTTVDGLNQGPSGCQEGNSIEVRNDPFDGTHPNTMMVEVAHNIVTHFQKTGIVANGDVEVDMHHNVITASATQANLAANSIQFGFGALGSAMFNRLEGNQWCGPSDYVATGMLLYQTDPNNMEVSQNIVNGNADVGIYSYGDGITLFNNKVNDGSDIVDCNTHAYDIGIGSYGADASVKNNKVGGYETPYEGVDGGKNKTVPGNLKKGEPYF